jgi:PhnB protein
LAEPPRQRYRRPRNSGWNNRDIALTPAKNIIKNQNCCPEPLGWFVLSLKHKQPINIMNTKTDPSVQAYLFFNGNCEQAVEFYKKAVGAVVEMTLRYKESPEPPPPGMVPPGFENKIMHTSFRIGQTMVMASDGCSSENPKFEGFSLALSVHTEAEADKAFKALAEGGQVKMPLTKTFWSPRFGMLTDRFGIGWMVSVPGQPA